MILDANILSRKVPSPRNGFDDLQVAQQPIGNVKSRKLRAESLKMFDQIDSFPEVYETSGNPLDYPNPTSAARSHGSDPILSLPNQSVVRLDRRSRTMALRRSTQEWSA
jgi:hypothetical protein